MEGWFFVVFFPSWLSCWACTQGRAGAAYQLTHRGSRRWCAAISAANLITNKGGVGAKLSSYSFPLPCPAQLQEITTRIAILVIQTIPGNNHYLTCSFAQCGHSLSLPTGPPRCLLPPGHTLQAPALVLCHHSPAHCCPAGPQLDPLPSSSGGLSTRNKVRMAR